MKKIKKIKISDFDYNLPQERIAYFPETNREKSRMIYWNGIDSKILFFENIVDILNETHFIILNDTKVIKARLLFKKENGAKIEIFCLNPAQDNNENSKKVALWECFVGNNKRWKTGELCLEKTIENQTITLKAEKIQNNKDNFVIKFSWNNDNYTFYEILDIFGNIPLPPYIKRDSQEIDASRYQTIYAKKEGSVAAPTAGLHFTEDILKKLSNKKIHYKTITLHVSAGTFKPIKSENICEHIMHSEEIFIETEVINYFINAIEKNKKFVNVGTTTVRTLESLYWFGVKKMEDYQNPNCVEQWLPYEYNKPLPDRISVLKHLLDLYKESKQIHFSTSLFIIPGYKFQFVDGLITNFHQPKSTLLMLVAAFIGDEWKKIYETAIKENMRFLSYGDCCFLLPDKV